MCDIFLYLLNTFIIVDYFFRDSIASSLMPLSRVNAPYWYYENYVLIFVWYSLVFTPYIYYCDFFCLGPALHICDCACHMWVRFIDNTKIMVVCMSSLIFLYWYFIMFYFKLDNGAMDKWWMVKWCNDEIKIRIGRFFFKKL